MECPTQTIGRRPTPASFSESNIWSALELIVLLLPHMIYNRLRFLLCLKAIHANNPPYPNLYASITYVRRRDIDSSSVTEKLHNQLLECEDQECQPVTNPCKKINYHKNKSTSKPLLLPWPAFAIVIIYAQ